MSELQFSILFFVVGLFLYSLKSSYIPFYVLFLYIVGTPFVAYFLIGFESQIKGFHAFTYVTSFQRSFILVLCMVEILRKRKISIFYPLFIIGSILLLFLFFWCYYHSLTFKNVYVSYFVVFDVVPFLIFLFVNKGVQPNSIIKFFLFVFLLEVFAVVVNLFGIYFFESSYLGLHNVTISKISGTFHRFNALSNYLTIMFLFLCLEFLTNSVFSRARFSVTFFLLSVIVVLTGSRASLVFLFLSVVVSFLAFSSLKQKVLFISLSIFAISFLYIIILQYSGYTTSHAQNGLQRIIFGFTEFVSGSGESTVSLSENLFSFFKEKWLMGLGLDMTGSQTNDDFRDFVVVLMSDSRLAFMMAQYGVLGFFLFLSFFLGVYSFLVKRLNRNGRMKLRIVFLLMLVLTITEPGFFEFNLFALVAFYSYYLNMVDRLGT